MKKLQFPTDPTSIILSVILILAAVLRFYHLTTQSLWVDELITMSEVDPYISWGSMFSFLDIADPHPPLFFILERITCSIFGYTEGVAKGLNALIGSVSVLFIYYLGKEILNKKLGLVAAILLCVNYYSLYYSQEGRDYALALCTSILANLFFIRLLKNPSYKSARLYGLFALLLLYTHYFGLFIIAGHGLLVVALMFSKSGVQKPDFRYFFTAAAAIVVGYLPWMPSFLKQLKITSFWIPPIPQGFATSYFFEYFGNVTILEPVLILMLLFYCLQVYSNQQHEETKRIADDPLTLSFCVVFFTVFSVFYIPYIRSLLVVPMLQSRYTIVIIPAFLMAIAYGFILIKSDLIRNAILAGVIVLTGVDLVNRKFYATDPIKTQFREATQFMQEVGGAYPLIESGSTIWPHGYYLHHYRYDLPTFWGHDKIDSVLRSPFSKYQVDGFWLFGAFPDETHLKPEVQRQVDSAFTVVKSKTFFQSWAELYVRKTGSWKSIFVSPFDLGKDVVRYHFYPEIILVDSLRSKPILLQPGKYRLLIEQSGISISGELPKVSISIGDRKIGDIIGTEEGPYYGEKGLTFTVEAAETAPIKLQLTNPLSAAEGKRRVYVKFIRIIPLTEQGNLPWGEAEALTPDNGDIARYLPETVYYSNERVIPIWNSYIISSAIKLDPGRYRLKIIHMGSKAAGAYPHVNVLVNEKKIGDFITNKSLSESRFQFEIKAGESQATIKLVFDNDLMANGEDRNAFIKSMFILPSE